MTTAPQGQVGKKEEVETVRMEEKKGREEERSWTSISCWSRAGGAPQGGPKKGPKTLGKVVTCLLGHCERWVGPPKTFQGLGSLGRKTKRSECILERDCRTHHRGILPLLTNCVGTSVVINKRGEDG